MARFPWSRLVLASSLLSAFAGTAHAAGAVVEIRNKRYEPAEITVAVGAPVTWTNFDGDGVQANYRHNAVARDDSWRTPLLQTNESATMTFDVVGKYQYYCSLHPGMIGQLDVIKTAPPATDMVGAATDRDVPVSMLVVGLVSGVGAFALTARRRRMTLR